MTSYFSLAFLAAFLPAIVLVYSVSPRRVRWVVLLISSLAFFWCISGKLIAFLVLSALSIYAAGLGMQAIKRRSVIESGVADDATSRRASNRMKLVAGSCIALNVAILAVFKYTPFLGELATSLLHLLGTGATLSLPAFAAPIGVSFYTLMAVSYLVDVYRGSVEADRNPARVTLYLCFFPHVMEGPICRYGETARQLAAGDPVRKENFYAGALRILFGLAKKMIVADRLNSFVKPVFDNHGAYDGGIVALAAALYTVQLYCDFSGTMDVALGTSRIFGISLPENFRQPFFSRTAAEFWRRWHVTLGAWFRDYVYYPVSLSRPIKRLARRARRRLGSRYGPIVSSSVALSLVWLGNGLWHGAGSQYLFFGMYYFVTIMAGMLVDPIAQKAARKAGIDREGFGYRLFQVGRTLAIVIVGELFFRANGLSSGITMFFQMVTDFTFESYLNGSVLSIGMDGFDFVVVGMFSAVLLAVGVLRERECDPLERICAMRTPIRWFALIALILAVAIFGAYGTGYTPVDPIYAAF